ncbi:MAG: hypothetical protein AVDCRST_MAG89-4479, partial [uncultured Gemmatimonadetes bacterium]
GERVHALVGAHVGGHGVAAHFRGGARQRLGRARHQAHPGPRGRKLARHSQSDAAGRARHQRRLSLQPLHPVPL